MEDYASDWVDIWIPGAGGDQAPVLRQAEAKAHRYAPLIKSVDESRHRQARSLTGFWQLSGRERKRSKSPAR
jgi:hypothetical protein